MRLLYLKKCIIGGMERIKPQESASHLEIERRFLLREIPTDIDWYPRHHIIQGYYTTAEGKIERVRRKGRKYYKTAKDGEGKIRTETEIPITNEEFYSIWPKTLGARIEKIRYQIPHGRRIIELDNYRGNLRGLFRAEIEFKNEAESLTFEPPLWLGEEVTEDIGYTDYSLAVQGIPKPKP
jgi:CYTH domain-containing protein